MSGRRARCSPGVPETAPWTQCRRRRCHDLLCRRGRDRALSYRDRHYRDNLATGEPKLWILLRPTGVEPAYDCSR